MRRTRRPGAVGLALAGCLVLAACADDADPGSGAEPTRDVAADCTAAVDGLLATAQRYLDSIEGTSPSAAAEPAQPPADPAQAEREFTSALANVRQYASGLGCDPRQFRDELAGGLGELEAGGPVANAVLLQLRADSGVRPPAGPVPPGGDVAAAVAAAEPGGVVELAAGTHELPETLVLLRGVTLRGAGRDATTLTGSGGEGVVLVLTGEPVALDALSLARAAGSAGSVVTASPSAALTITGSRVSGAQPTADGSAGVGVLMASGPGGQTGPSRRTTLVVRDSEVVDNAIGGVVVSGEHRTTLERVVVRGSAECGVCFLGSADGTATDLVLEANAAGLVVAGEARPAVSGGTVTGGEVGVQAFERGAPQVRGIAVTGAARAAFLFADDSAGSVRESRCADVPIGVVVGPRAVPELEGNEGCELVRGQ